MLYDWLCLYYTKNIGSKRLLQLINHFGSADIAVSASNADWSRAGIPDSVINERVGDHQTKAESAINWIDEADYHHILCINDEDYPPLLKEINDPPPLLFLKGERALLNAPQLAIVGTRHPTREGSLNAYQFAKELGSYGFVITSGLAMGVDERAHCGAADHDQPTIAVLGTGLNHIYPKQNQALSEAIIEKNGCLISEFPLYTPPIANNFPRRNRIIAGLALGTLVVEAAARSGSLITARLSMEYNREVFAIPSSIHNTQSKGCHQLIRNGAKLVESTQDIYEELKNWIPYAKYAIPAVDSAPIHNISPVEKSTKPHKPQRIPKDTAQKILFDLLIAPHTVDDLVEKTKNEPSELMNHLLLMEIEGFIENIGGGRFSQV